MNEEELNGMASIPEYGFGVMYEPEKYCVTENYEDYIQYDEDCAEESSYSSGVQPMEIPIEHIVEYDHDNNVVIIKTESEESSLPLFTYNEVHDNVEINHLNYGNDYITGQSTNEHICGTEYCENVAGFEVEAWEQVKHQKEDIISTVKQEVEMEKLEFITDEYLPEHNPDSQTTVIKQEPLPDAVENYESFKKYYCCECKTVFNDLESAEKHNCLVNETSVTKSIENHLEYCFLSEFEKIEDLEQHQHNYITITDAEIKSYEFRCKECGKVFASIKALHSHNRVHKKKVSKCDGPVTCAICNTLFSSEKNLKLHMKIHRDRKIKSIQEALPTFAKIEYNELNQFFCEICNKSFEQNLLAVHKNMHQSIEEYTCSTCNRQFENLPSYEVHMQMHADKPNQYNGPSSSKRPPKDKLRYPCQYCGRVFPRPYEKVKHERVHTGEKPYDCEVCGKTFRVSYSLTLHLRTHTNIRPYVCSVCNKRFKSQPVYAHHLKIHVAERAYNCDTCHKSFRTSVQLCGHRNSHLKPYNCPECNRPFATLYAVKIHLKTHNKFNKANENLKYNCSICGAVYARTFALRLHMKEQHGLHIETTDLPETQQLREYDAEDDKKSVLVSASAEVNCAEFIESADTDEDQLDLQQTVVVDNFEAEEIVAAADRLIK